MARMTRKLENGRYAQNYTTGDGFMVGITEMMQKLGRLEDLEEAGRLVILPEGDGRTIFLNVLAVSDEICPCNLGLKNIHCTRETDCVDCWEAALKGGGQE